MFRPTTIKVISWLSVFSLLSFAMFCFGVTYAKMVIEPKVITETEYVFSQVPKYVLIEVPKEIYPTAFHQFQSQEELSKWQAKQYLELQELGKKNNWVCVDYALEIQRRAWQEGYQMSVQNLIDEDGRTGHAVCSTWIGDKCIYLEPQSTKSWFGAAKGQK